jgi:hypothetical protein
MNKLQFKAYMNIMNSEKVTIKSVDKIARDMYSKFKHSTNKNIRDMASTYYYYAGDKDINIKIKDFFFDFIVFTKATKKHADMSSSSLPRFIFDAEEALSISINQLLFSNKLKNLAITYDEYMQLFEFSDIKFSSYASEPLSSLVNLAKLIGSKKCYPVNIHDFTTDYLYQSSTTNIELDKWIELDSLRQDLPDNRSYTIINDALKELLPDKIEINSLKIHESKKIVIAKQELLQIAKDQQCTTQSET